MAPSFAWEERSEGTRTFEFLNEPIREVRLDSAVTLLTDRIEVRIERVFEIHDDDQRLTVVPGHQQGVASVGALHRASVQRVILSDDGSPRMEIDNSRTIAVAPSSSGFEAFELSIEGGWKFVSIPGGGLSVWSGRPGK